MIEILLETGLIGIKRVELTNALTPYML